MKHASAVYWRTADRHVLVLALLGEPGESRTGLSQFLNPDKEVLSTSGDRTGFCEQDLLKSWQPIAL